MAPKKKKDSSVTAIPSAKVGRPTVYNTVEDVVKMVIINGITVEQALKACDLHGVIPVNTIYSRVKTRRENGTYNALLRSAEEKRRIGSLVVDITSDDGCNHHVSKEGAVSPITMDTSLTSSTLLQHESVAVDSASQSHSNSQQQLSSSSSSSCSTIKTGVSRLSSKQAGVARLEAKRTKLDYDGRFKAAFKDATNLVAENSSSKGSEPVQSICTRLNLEYNLVGSKSLKRSTVYQAAQNGLAGTSPKKRGPAPKIPMVLLEVAATHSQVCQAGDGELKGKDIKRLIGASIVGTKYEEPSRSIRCGGSFEPPFLRNSKQQRRPLLRTPVHNGRHSTI
ncbi:hypothetical protein MHU86_17189 [Fragilaria crotonensis]|nr:hypothetical protein MHU86_17189 [Fragilaria crotonensis]